MATHSSISVWTEEPGRLQSMGSQTVGHNYATTTSLIVSTLSLVQEKSIPNRFENYWQVQFLPILIFSCNTCLIWDIFL